MAFVGLFDNKWLNCFENCIKCDETDREIDILQIKSNWFEWRNEANKLYVCATFEIYLDAAFFFLIWFNDISVFFRCCCYCCLKQAN